MLNLEDAKSLGQKLFLIERPLSLATCNCLSIIPETDLGLLQHPRWSAL